MVERRRRRLDVLRLLHCSSCCTRECDDNRRAFDSVRARVMSKGRDHGGCLRAFAHAPSSRKAASDRQRARARWQPLELRSDRRGVDRFNGEKTSACCSGRHALTRKQTTEKSAAFNPRIYSATLKRSNQAISRSWRHHRSRRCRRCRPPSTRTQSAAPALAEGRPP